jgi:hypothetical protein
MADAWSKIQSLIRDECQTGLICAASSLKDRYLPQQKQRYNYYLLE